LGYIVFRRVEMGKTAQIRARVDPDLKARAEGILQMLGMTPTEAIRLFYRQVDLMKGLPFEVRVPNATTLATMDRTDRGEDLRSFENADEMFDSLDL
jgi:DNA-damage-inducible protein J